MQCLSFYTVALIGVALLLGWALKSSNNTVSVALTMIAFLLSCLVVAVYGFFYATRRDQSTVSMIIHIIVWGVAVTLIVVFRILNKG